MYIQSEKVNIFPLSKPRLSVNQKNNRLIGEDNLANIIRQITRKDNDGFVISDTYSNSIEVNIHGYHIEINDDISTVATNTSPIWICISIPTSADFPEIYGQDTGGYYQGVEVIQSAAKPTSALNIGGTSYTRYSIKALEYSGNNWNIPTDSKIIFSKTMLDLDVVDGGKI